jgi:hypothetical protein
MSTKVHSIIILKQQNQTFNGMGVSELPQRTAYLLTTGKADMDGERNTFGIFAVNLPDGIIQNSDTHKMVVVMS